MKFYAPPHGERSGFMYTNNFKIVVGEKENVAERKKQLRAYMKRRRGDNANRDVKEDRLVKNFFELLKKIYPTGAWSSLTLFVYLSYSSEAKTDKLVERKNATVRMRTI